MLTRAERQRGVTLIESMVAVAVIAVLMVLATPMAVEWLANSRIRTAGESMLAGLQLARAEAVKRNTPVEFVLDGDSTAGWSVNLALSGETIQSRAGGEGTADVTVTSAPAGATTISFDGLGRRTDNSDASAAIETVALDSATLAAAKSRDLRLQLSRSGQVVMCDPNVVSNADVRRCR